MKGMITDIQKFSLHDGPGIRTTIFFKGCPMHCVWCHNPEAMSFSRFLRFHPDRCIGCGICFERCQSKALMLQKGQRVYDKTLCKLCFACADGCPANALESVGYEMEANEVAAVALADQAYYAASGGGVTLSGGEPTAQPEFALEILRLLKQKNIHTAIETSLCTGYAGIEGLLLYLDENYCDIKLLDDELHRKYTGLSNEKILDGIRKLAATGKKLTVRTPLIPGITDSEENICRIAGWLREHAPKAGYELLNYNPLAQAKWQEMGNTYIPGMQKQLSCERIEELQNMIR